MNFFIWLSLIFFSFETQAATVNSIVSNSEAQFGEISTGATAGTFETNCNTTGGIVSHGGCQEGSVSITTTTHANTARGRRIRLFVEPKPTSLSGPGGSISLDFNADISTVAGCQFNKKGRLTCNNYGSSIGDVKIWTLPIKGILSNIATNQTNGAYSGSYSVIACTCCENTNSPTDCPRRGCPNDSSDSRCQAPWGTTFTPVSIELYVRKALSIVQFQALDFGNVAPDANGGTVTMDVSGNIPDNDGIIIIGGTSQSAIFNVEGENNASYSIINSNPNMTLSGPGTAMPVVLSLVSGGASRVLSGSGQDTIGIKGSLTINPNQPQGEYIGTYDVQIGYN